MARRKNGTWIRVVVTIAGVALTAAGILWASGRKAGQLEHTVSNNKEEIAILRPKVEALEKTQAEIHTDVKWIRKKLEE